MVIKGKKGIPSKYDNLSKVFEDLSVKLSDKEIEDIIDETEEEYFNTLSKVDPNDYVTNRRFDACRTLIMSRMEENDQFKLRLIDSLDKMQIEQNSINKVILESIDNINKSIDNINKVINVMAEAAK